MVTSGSTSKTTLLTLVAKRRLEPIFHDGSDNALYRLGIIDVRERPFGGGQFQELAATKGVSPEWHLLKLFWMTIFSHLRPGFGPGFH